MATIDIGRVSQISGEYHVMTIPMSENEFITRYSKFRKGVHIQDAFDNLDRGLREFILTGITPDEWDEMCGTEEE